MAQVRPMTKKEFDQFLARHGMGAKNAGLVGPEVAKESRQVVVNELYQKYAKGDTDFYTSTNPRLVQLLQEGDPWAHQAYQTAQAQAAFKKQSDAVKQEAKNAVTPAEKQQAAQDQAQLKSASALGQAGLTAAGLGYAVPNWVTQYMNGKQPNQQQLTQWWHAAEASSPSHWKTLNDFLNSDYAYTNPEAQTLFQQVINKGTTDSTRTYIIRKGATVPVAGANMGIHVPNQTVTLPTDAAAQAEVNKTASKIMPDILAASQETGVPWQLIWGTIRATSGFDAHAQSATGKGLALAPDDGGLGTKARRDTHSAPRYVAQELSLLYRQYGDWGLAVVALKDPGAAGYIQQHGVAPQGQAATISGWVRQVAGDASSNGKGKTVSLTNLGYGNGPEASSVPLDFLSQVGEGTQSIQMPDQSAVAKAATDMYRSWFLTDPSPDQLNQMTSGIMGMLMNQNQQQAYANEQANNPFYKGGNIPVPQVDQTSELEKMLKENPEYAQLFGRKPSGVSESDYANQFASVAQSYEGKANPAAARVGMQTNSPDAERGFEALGQMGGAGTEANGSTDFRSKLYQAASVVQRILGGGAGA